MSTPPAATQWTITESGTDTSSGTLDGYLIKENAAGDRHLHTFPMEALEWRAAEYGIDPADFDTLLDVIAHEPHLPDPADPANVRLDAAAARGHVSPAVEPRRGVVPLEMMPTTLFNAESVELARGAHLERIAHAKRTVANVNRPTGKNDPCKPLRAAWTGFVDAAEVENKRASIDRKRQQMQTSAAKRAARGETGTRLRARLDRHITLEAP